jgi:hypothetical protein
MARTILKTWPTSRARREAAATRAAAEQSLPPPEHPVATAMSQGVHGDGSPSSEDAEDLVTPMPPPNLGDPESDDDDDNDGSSNSSSSSNASTHSSNSNQERGTDDEDD